MTNFVACTHRILLELKERGAGEGAWTYEWWALNLRRCVKEKNNREGKK